jgi:hypothetical protein
VVPNPSSLVVAVDLLKVGSFVTLKNAKVDMFKGMMRLVIGQGGSIEVAEGAAFQPKASECTYRTLKAQKLHLCSSLLPVH